MKVVIKTKDIELDSILKKWIEEKVDSLEKFSRIFEKENYYGDFFGKGKPVVEAWVEVGKETRHHKKGHVFFAEIQMRFPQKSLRSVVRSDNLRKAVNEAKDEIGRQIRKYKERIPHSLAGRRQRAFKKELKISPAARKKKAEREREEGI